MKSVFLINYQVVVRSLTGLLLAQTLLLGFDFIGYAQAYKAEQPLHGCGVNCVRLILTMQDNAVRQRIIQSFNQTTPEANRTATVYRSPNRIASK
jgi:hypothetical protein